MYWNVPRIVPSCVRFACVGRAVWLSGAPGGSTAFARPKSRSLTPDFVSMTLPGFRSRCTMPWRCALSRASAISSPYRSVWSSASGPRASRSDSVSPSRYSMTRYCGLALAADVVERADVRDARTARSSSPRARSAAAPPATTPGAAAAPSPRRSARAACPAPCTPRPCRPPRSARGSRKARAWFLREGSSCPYYRGTFPAARGTESLPTEGREEARAAGAKRGEEVRLAVEPTGEPRAGAPVERRPPRKRSDGKKGGRRGTAPGGRNRARKSRFAVSRGRGLRDRRRR